MVQDMNQDRRVLRLQELKELLRETLKHSIEGEFSAPREDPYFYTKKAYPLQTEIEGLPLLYQVCGGCSQLGKFR